ncbi:hypothetical protein T484DRAFT_1780562 [Baffinella frigidus]|nr:hypothetical protein T484DRAFT_1780562 [Cryptophyta sp. CCMP2293]
MDAAREVILWRGLKDVQVPNLPHPYILKVPQEFVEIGGTEFAPMSTTTDVKTALMFSAGGSSVLFRLCTTNPLKRGADISFLSAFPEENEILFPPLTFLAPIRPPQEIRLGTDKLFIVLDVEPILP